MYSLSLTQLFILTSTLLNPVAMQDVEVHHQYPPGNTPILSQPPYDLTRKPLPKIWVDNKDIFLDWLIKGCKGSECDTFHFDDIPTEYEGYDGFYNNFGQPDLGAIDTPLLRRVPAAYEDGVYKLAGSKRPNPLKLSEKLMGGKMGTSSKTGKTALLVFFGQMVVEEILDAQRPACPPEYINIEIPDNHDYKKLPLPAVMPVLRTRYDMTTGHSPSNPRQQLNEITPWIDGGLFYGTSKMWSDFLRKDSTGKFVKDGTLASSHEGLFPAKNDDLLPMANPPSPYYHKIYTNRHETDSVKRFFKLGNPRGNENPFLLTFGILWFRWHNHLAKYLKKHTNWSDEKIYNEARKWVIAVEQHMIVEEWLPELLGKELPLYEGYDATVNPQIDQFFQAAAFRFGHTLVPPGVYIRDYGRNGCDLLRFENYTSLRTCQHYWRPHESLENITNIDQLLMGMSLQLTEQEDNVIIEDLRGQVFGPLEFSRRDLMALNIQRGRDHGLPDYNSARRAYKLPPKHFSDFPQFMNDLMDLYNNNTDDIDVWVGGLLETNDGPGELFTAIILDQFLRIRNGDRFWYNNTLNGLFTIDQIDRIKKVTMYDLLLSVTNMSYNDIQRNPFRAPQRREDVHDACHKLLTSSFECKRQSEPTRTCFSMEPLNVSTIEQCNPGGTYDYFSRSSASFVATYGIVCVLTVSFLGFLIFIGRNTRKQELNMNGMPRAGGSFFKEIQKLFSALELVETGSPWRQVNVLLDSEKKKIRVASQCGQILRAMDLSHAKVIQTFIITDGLHVMLRVSHDYDMVLKFDGARTTGVFLKAFDEFLNQINIQQERFNLSFKSALHQIITKNDRQKRLDMFFRVVFSQAFNISHSEDEILKVDANSAKEIIYTELTLAEFADALDMKEDSEFVQKMFSLVDKDHNGFISFREFVDMLIIFAKGSAEDKIKLMFDMYDINATGLLTRSDFKNMLRSFMETVNADVDQAELDSVIKSMMNSVGLGDKQSMNLSDFQCLLDGYKDKLCYAQLNFCGLPSAPEQRSSFVQRVRKAAFSLYGSSSDVRLLQQSSIEELENSDVTFNTLKIMTKPTIWLAIVRAVENTSLVIFWIVLYTLVLLAVFAERAYYYSVEREQSGLRRIAGYGVTITRGAASAMMFTYSSLLVTMCRNTITLLRDSFLHIYIPFDSALFFHKYIAYWALFFTVMHIIGHMFNFYSISTQTSDDLTCLFRNYNHASHEIPKFHYWTWQTVTGVTGIFLVLVTLVIYALALPFARTKFFHSFWIAHSLYPLFYILLFLHGTGRLIQEPYLHYFFVGPCVMFAIDRLIIVGRKKVEVPILRAEILPSNVTYLEFKKPADFEYKSGQWLRIACSELNPSEYHPFTLSSAPNESTLTVHIRAVGRWTTNIRALFDPTVVPEQSFHKLFIEGPYGESHQDWYQHEVAVLVGGGIGVTPFASILKDIVFKSNLNQGVSCRKVYFFWVTKSQKQFEWLVDIIREVENKDKNHIISVHIFVTQFYQKFDLRTVLLYICERHFQRISNKSLFTGLRSITHFGRPDFFNCFQSIQAKNNQARKIGIFSCGPPLMTRSVDKACRDINKNTVNGPVLQHYFKNF